MVAREKKKKKMMVMQWRFGFCACAAEIQEGRLKFDILWLGQQGGRVTAGGKSHGLAQLKM